MRMMSKALVVLILVFLGSLFGVFPAAAQTPKVIVDGRELYFDVPPVIEKGRVLVPLRGIFEALGAKVSWYAKKRMIVATKRCAVHSLGIYDRQVTLWIGRPVAEIKDTSDGTLINSQRPFLEVPPKILRNRTLVPLRFVSETLMAEVNWLADTRTVAITSLEAQERAYNQYLEKNARRFQAPAAPTGLRVVAYEVAPGSPGIRLTLSWDPVNNATRYKLYSSLYSDGTWSQWQLYTTIPDNSFTISFAGPSEAGVAFYVTAENEAGESPASNVLNLANDAHLQELLANLHLQGLQPEETTSVVPADYYSSFGPFYRNTLSELVQYLRIPVNLPAYEANILDCSEAAAMMEWRLQNAGFDAYIAVGQMYGGYHAWVIAKCRDGTVAIEATRWYAPRLWDVIWRTRENLNILDWLWDYGPGITRVDEKYFKCEDLFDDIYRAIGKYSLEEWEWWNELHRRGMCTCIPSVDQGGCSGG